MRGHKAFGRAGKEFIISWGPWSLKFDLFYRDCLYSLFFWATRFRDGRHHFAPCVVTQRKRFPVA